jgi:hypothetical protein
MMTEHGALLVIDNAPIRRQIELELQSVSEAIEQCDKEINRHESLDLPAFRQWLAVECSDLLNQRRLMEEKIWGLRARLAAIQGLAQHGIGNVAAAFFWFREIEQETSVIPPYVRRAWEEVTVIHPGKSRTRSAESGRSDAGLEVEDKEAFTDWNDEADNGPFFDDSERLDSETGEKEEIPRHKSLFRKIALLLHPDLAGVLTKKELELWYQAQQAYAEEDIVALETILARCDRVGTNSLTLSELRALVCQSNSRLATLRQSITSLADLSSWRFLLLSASELKIRLRAVRRELESLVRDLSREASMMENELAKIEARTERWIRRKSGMEKQLALDL